MLLSPLKLNIINNLNHSSDNKNATVPYTIFVSNPFIHESIKEIEEKQFYLNTIDQFKNYK